MRSNNIKNTYSSSIFDAIAARNVRKSAKDYFIYFFTLMLSVCLFYSFNSVSTQFDSLGLIDRFNYLAFSSGVLTAFSILICFIMGALVVYANRFLLKRRKKEMGIYATLGMEQKDLNRILMKETYRIGALSLVVGLIIGVFAAQILSLITAGLAGVSLSSYHFMISGKAILMSIVFFGILFFSVHRFNVKELKKMSLIEMLYAERKNESVSKDKLSWMDVLSVLCSVSLILGGYAVIFFKADSSVMMAVGIGGLMLIVGTLFFFNRAFRIMAGIMKRKDAFYYRGLNMFTASQFSARLKSEGRSSGLISVLLFLALTLTILGTGMGKYAMNGSEYANPYDGTISYAIKNQNESSEEVMSQLVRTGFRLHDFSNSYVSFRIFNTPALTSEFLSGDSGSKNEGEEGESPLLQIMGADDYNRIRMHQGAEPISLKENEFALSYAFPNMEKITEAFVENPKMLTLDGTELTLAEHGVYRCAWENRNALVETGTVIIPQKVAEGLTASRWMLNFNFIGDKKEAEQRLYSDWLAAETGNFRLEGGQETIISITADNLLMTYLGIYLGITFLITSGAVLALQQLSQSSDNARRYDLLRKLGASHRDRKNSLTNQLKVYFGMPMLVAGVHSLVVSVLIFRYLEGLSLSVIISIIGFSVLLIGGAYIVYFIATYTGSRRILRL